MRGGMFPRRPGISHRHRLRITTKSSWSGITGCIPLGIAIPTTLLPFSRIEANRPGRFPITPRPCRLDGTDDTSRRVTKRIPVTQNVPPHDVGREKAERKNTSSIRGKLVPIT